MRWFIKFTIKIVFNITDVKKILSLGKINRCSNTYIYNGEWLVKKKENPKNKNI